MTAMNTHKLRKLQDKPSSTCSKTATATSVELNIIKLTDKSLDHNRLESRSTAVSRENGANTQSVAANTMTMNEQYWAARAIKAEALLIAKDDHHREVRTVQYSQEIKRSREISELAKQFKEKQVVLERLIIALLGILSTLVLLVVYLAIRYSRRCHLRQNWWPLTSHFTIPILSPFTSVVEQETSVIGTKSIGLMVVTFACVAYMAFRHYIARFPSR